MGEVLRMGSFQIVGEIIRMGSGGAAVRGEGGWDERGKRHWKRLLERRGRTLKSKMKGKSHTQSSDAGDIDDDSDTTGVQSEGKGNLGRGDTARNKRNARSGKEFTKSELYNSDFTVAAPATGCCTIFDNFASGPMQ